MNLELNKNHINPNLLKGLKSLYGIEDSLEKGGGEGSKGGHVIGHTKSGKPIYANSLHTSKDFTHEDHSDAMSAHMKEAKEHGEMGERHQTRADRMSSGKDRHKIDENNEMSHRYKNSSQHHSSMAALHQGAMNSKLDESSTDSGKAMHSLSDDKKKEHS